MKCRENLLIKALAFLGAAAAFGGATALAGFQLINFNVIWGGSSPAESSVISNLEQQDYSTLLNLLSAYNTESQDSEYSLYLSQQITQLESALSADNTNLRWQVRDSGGNLRYSNTSEDIPLPVEGLYAASVHMGTQAPSVGGQTLDVTLWLETGFPIVDKYETAYLTLTGWQSCRGLLLGVTIACAAAGLLLTVFLCAGAGHKRGVEGIWLHWFHRIPGDLLLAVFLLGAAVFTCGLSVISFSALLNSTLMYAPALLIGALTASASAAGLAALVTFAARCKAHTLWRNTLIWRLCRKVYRVGRSVGAAMPLIWKTALGGMAWLLLSAFLIASKRYFLWFVLSAALAALLCLWAWQWKRICRGTRKIIGGRPDYRIDTSRMLPDLRRHAEQLNALGSAVDHAVDERMKSERFKTELITNVSHDLKTPLTSIINYVDLLKKLDIADPKAQEYIDVLDRKSQRLKKLTEDLVEASKASTGALTVNRERLDVVQLMEQAAGEYKERLNAAGLTLVTSMPEPPVTVSADGRHLWRVVDNLLSNCAKYALEGTRVYLDVTAKDGNAVITVKNISRQPLNLPAEQLVERFVRGDESRTTEGSGLGLSIARSLTELQGGQFALNIDGDLFKAIVVFPLIQE